MTTQNIFDLSDTWNASGTTFAGIKLNVTDTASASGSLLMDLQRDGVSRFSVGKMTGSRSVQFDSGGQLLVSGITGGGLRWDGNNGFDLGVGAGWINIPSDWYLAWRSSASMSASVDLSLFRDAADTLAQRRGTNAQKTRIYRTFTDASNGSWIELDANSNGNAYIGTNKNGTGSTLTLYMLVGGTAVWSFSGGGHFLAGADNTYDIGASNATRPRNVHIAGYVSIGDGITAPGAGTGQARIYVDTDDGDLKVVFADGTVKTIVVDT
jgi:hypothetical protein